VISPSPKRDDRDGTAAENHLKAAAESARRRTHERSDGRLFSNVLIAGGTGQSLELAIALARSDAKAFLLLEDANEAGRTADILDRMIDGLPALQAGNRDLRERIAMGVWPAGSRMAFDLAIMTATGAEASGIAIKRIAPLLAPGTPVVTASSEGLESLLGETGRPVGAISFAGPVHLAQLAEVLVPGTGAGTGAGVEAGNRTGVSYAFSLAAQLDLLAVESRSPVSLGDRLSVALWRATDRLLFDGAAPAEVDEVMEEFGFSAGPCEMQDLAGVDVALAMRNSVKRAETTGIENEETVPPFLARMVAEGRLGRKVGVGFYRYPGGGGKVEDPLIEDLIREEAWFARHTQNPPGADTIRNRLLSALSRECTRLLDAGLALADDIDLVSVHALGFPACHGGLVRFSEGGRAGTTSPGALPG